MKLKSTMATLSVSTGTTGTQIFINDQQRGTSSWQGTLPPGTYRVEGRLAGHRTHRQNVTLASREQQQVTIPALVAITGMLNVNVQPMNAEVWLDGSRLGTSPDIFRNITVGSHSVELRAAGYTTKTESVTIREGQTTMLTSSLAKIPSEDAEIEGMTPAQICNLGYDYNVGRNGKVRDDAKAVKYYTIAAEKGNAKAQCNLGWMYLIGDGVTQDNAKALKWLKMSAEQGYASGQVYYGMMFDWGRGVTQSDTEAVKWYRKAAEQGDSYGQFWYGYMYDSGRGVTKDLKQAKYWYEKSAAQGNEKAKQNLMELNQRH